MIFDISISWILNNNKIWVIWAIKRKALYWCSWKYHFTKGRHKLKIPIEIFFEKVSFSNCHLWLLQNSNPQKQEILSYLSHKDKSTSLVLFKKPFYLRYTQSRNLHRSFFLKKCRSQAVVFDLSKNGIPKHNRIWVIWGIKRKALH